jgi:putative transposase
MSMPDRRAMIDPGKSDLSVRRQCELLAVARTGVYRPKSATTTNDLAPMRRIDELHLKPPFYGSRRMMFELNKESPKVNRKHAQRLMRLMGIVALVPCAGSVPRHEQTRGIAIRNGSRPAILWPQDLSLSAARRGDCGAQSCLGDRHRLYSDGAWLSLSRGGHRLGQSGGAGVAIIEHDGHALLHRRARRSACAIWRAEDFSAMRKHRRDNTDQGSRFTSEAFTGRLIAAAVAISMDGRGRFLDNIFIERLRRSIE